MQLHFSGENMNTQYDFHTCITHTQQQLSLLSEKMLVDMRDATLYLKGCFDVRFFVISQTQKYYIFFIQPWLNVGLFTEITGPAESTEGKSWYLKHPSDC